MFVICRLYDVIRSLVFIGATLALNSVRIAVDLIRSNKHPIMDQVVVALSQVVR